MIRHCLYCGDPYETDNARSKYCPEHKITTNREYPHERHCVKCGKVITERTVCKSCDYKNDIVTTTCLHCGKSFKVKKSYVRLYCSDECRHSSMKRKWNGELSLGREPRLIDLPGCKVLMDCAHRYGGRCKKEGSCKWKSTN